MIKGTKKITIKEAVELRSFANEFKGHKSFFGLACYYFTKSLESKLEDYEMEFHYKKIEFAIKGKSGEVLENERGGFLADENGRKNLQNWHNDKLKEVVEVDTFIVDEFKLIESNLEVLMLVNGIFIDIEIETYLNKE